MNIKYFHLIVIILLYSCKNKLSPNQNDIQDVINTDLLEQKAIENYNESPLVSIDAFNQISTISRQANNFKKSATANLNIAGIYDEKFSNYSESLKYSLESLQDWQKLNDTLQIANLKKYIGYLYGQNENYLEAEKNVLDAIHLYKIKEFEEGIAVSKINLARIKLHEKKLKDALKYFLDSKYFWTEENNQKRIFDNNLIGIEIYKAINDTVEMRNLIVENENILTDNKINVLLINKFEKIKSDI